MDLELHGYYRLPNGDGGFYQYVGKFKRREDAPNERCCYVIGPEVEICGVKVIMGKMLFRRNGPVDESQKTTKTPKRNRKDTSRPLNVAITKYDKDLMIIVKKILAPMTLKEFKAMYPNDSEMNNVRRIIEYDPADEKDRNKGNLTWERFIDITSRAGYGYDLMMYDKKTQRPVDLDRLSETSEENERQDDEEFIDIP